MSLLDVERVKKGYSYLLKSDQRSILLSISRSLVPDRDNMRVILDKRKFSDEMKLMKYYTNMQKNRSLLSCIAPIAFTNSDTDEIIKQSSEAFNILSGKEVSLIQKLSLYVIVSEIMGNDIKQAVIDYNIDSSDKNKIIEFQKAKINIIMSLDKKDSINEIFANLCGESFLQIDIALLQELKMAMDSDTAFNYQNTNTFDIKMTEYILDIRNFKIKRSFYNEILNPLDMIKHSKDDCFYIPILGNVTVLQKEMESKILKMKIEAKSGIYDFKFIKN